MSEPDWSLLPHSPRDFFGLSENFDRRDLKRAYGKLIRQYKPEHAPEEFRRIRVAYEALERNLDEPRGGNREASAGVDFPGGHDFSLDLDMPPGVEFTLYEQPQSPPTDRANEQRQVPPRERPVEHPPHDSPPAEDQQEHPEHHQQQEQRQHQWKQSQSHHQEHKPAHASPPPILKREEAVAEILQRLTPEQWYHELAAKPEKTVQDYIRLAFLGDLVAPAGEYLFAKWLCRGVRRFPTAPDLLHLLYQHCNEDLDLDESCHLIEGIGRALPFPQRLGYPRPLWSRLLRQDFERFRPLWDTHIHPSRDEQAEIIIPFLAEHLPSLLFLAEDDWLEEQVRTVNTYPELLTSQQEFFVELHQVLEDYFVCYRDTLKTHPRLISQLQAWHQKLGEACLIATTQEREEFVRLQQKLVLNFESWASEFPVSKKFEYPLKLARAWEWVSLSQQSLARLGATPQLTNVAAESVLRSFLKQGFQISRWRQLLSYWMNFFLLVLFFGAMALLTQFVSTHLTDLLVATGIPGYQRMTQKELSNSSFVTGWVFFLLTLPVLLLVSAKFGKKQLEWWYRKIIRPRLIRTFHQSRIAYWQYYSMMDDWVDHQSESTRALDFCKLSLRDPTLIIYRAALEFVQILPASTPRRKPDS